jgi:hypothetical protein
MNERLAKLGLAVLAMAAIAAPVALMTNAQAQQAGPTNVPPVQRPGGDFGQRNPGGDFGQRGQGPGMGMMGGGGAVMIDDNTNLYVLRGNTIFKVNKDSMRVVGMAQLPNPEMPQGFPGGGNRQGLPVPDRGQSGPPPPDGVKAGN